jgi:hypothetical protein
MHLWGLILPVCLLASCSTTPPVINERQITNRVGRLLALLLFTLPGMSQAVTVSTGQNGAAQITLANGKSATIPKELGQTGIRGARTALDGTAGWLAEYRVEAVADPVAGTLIIWRAGKIIQRFATGQSFYSWTFYANAKQVAYHVGPLHGELKSHCELHDVRNGRLIATWEGDLETGQNRPDWTKELTH